jgi:MFS family permease
MAAGSLVLTQLSNGTPLGLLGLAYAIFGVGMGSINAPITNSAVSGMPRSQAGIASAVASTSRQVGASLGVALAGSLAGSGIEAAHRADFAESTHRVFWVTATYGLVIVLIGFLSTSKRALRSAEKVATLLGTPEIADFSPPSRSRAPTVAPVGAE